MLEMTSLVHFLQYRIYFSEITDTDIMTDIMTNIMTNYWLIQHIGESLYYSDHIINDWFREWVKYYSYLLGHSGYLHYYIGHNLTPPLQLCRRY